MSPVVTHSVNEVRANERGEGEVLPAKASSFRAELAKGLFLFFSFY
jgi:hypothetical protein